MQYIQQEDGMIIDGYRATEIRRYARSIWVGLARKGNEFNSWGEADHEALKLYYSEMAIRFPELRLCSLDWKADLIALDNFPSWKSAWKKKGKIEDTLEEGESSGPLLKRVPEEFMGSTQDHKRLRTENTGTPLQPLFVAGTIQPPAINLIPGTPAKPTACTVSYCSSAPISVLSAIHRRSPVTLLQQIRLSFALIQGLRWYSR